MLATFAGAFVGCAGCCAGPAGAEAPLAGLIFCAGVFTSVPALQADAEISAFGAEGVVVAAAAVPLDPPNRFPKKEPMPPLLDGAGSMAGAKPADGVSGGMLPVRDGLGDEPGSVTLAVAAVELDCDFIPSASA